MPATLQNLYQTSPCGGALVAGVPADLGLIAPSPMGFMTSALYQCQWTPGLGGADYFLTTLMSECSGVGGTASLLGYVAP